MYIYWNLTNTWDSQSTVSINPSQQKIPSWPFQVNPYQQLTPKATTVLIFSHRKLVGKPFNFGFSLKVGATNTSPPALLLLWKLGAERWSQVDKSVCFISFDPLPPLTISRSWFLSLPGWKEFPLNGTSRDLWPWLIVTLRVKSIRSGSSSCKFRVN